MQSAAMAISRVEVLGQAAGGQVQVFVGGRDVQAGAEAVDVLGHLGGASCRRRPLSMQGGRQVGQAFGRLESRAGALDQHADRHQRQVLVLQIIDRQAVVERYLLGSRRGCSCRRAAKQRMRR